MDSPFAFHTVDSAQELSRAVRSGRARRLGRGVYTFDLETPAEQLVREHWLELVGHFCPGAVVTDRSAVRGAPDNEGTLYVVHDRVRPLTLPGLTVLPRAGAAALADDVPLPHGVWLCSRARGLVDNLYPARARAGRPPRSLTRRERHDWIVRLLRVEGGARLGEYRDRARAIATSWGLGDAFAELDDAIGAALGTRNVETASPALAAARKGFAYDERREETFAALAAFLDRRAPAPRPVLDAQRTSTLPFFEAYFSNFIEGTEFTLDEARDIVFGGAIPSERPADAHDVIGTYRVVSDEAGLRRLPADFDAFVELLRRRHAQLMEARPEKRPGQLKERANRAGSTDFVAPERVLGTLARGWTRLQRLSDPFARAAFMMFLVSEVHPFDDGNGRVARVFMNAELVAAGEHRIIVPTVYRTEYLSGLRALTHNTQPGPLLRVLDFAQRYTAQLDFSSFDSARRALTATNAFADPLDALNRGLRLELPSALEHNVR